MVKISRMRHFFLCLKGAAAQLQWMNVLEKVAFLVIDFSKKNQSPQICKFFTFHPGIQTLFEH
jgi:hypothetical protein